MTPVAFDGKLWRVQLLVKDIVEPKNDRTVVHTIDGIQIDEMEKPPVDKSQLEGGSSYVEGVTADDNQRVVPPVQFTQDRTVSIAYLLDTNNRYIRADDRPLFAEIGEDSRSEGGVYYESHELNQIVGRKGALSTVQGSLADDATGNIWQARSVALEMEFDGKTPREIFDKTGWQRGADGEWRYEIDDPVLKDTAFDALKEDRAKWERKEDEFFESKETDSLSVDEQNAIIDKIWKDRDESVAKTTLGEVIDAPMLFKAYPQLRTMTVEFGPLPKGVGGYYDWLDNVIRLDKNADILPAKTHSNLIHEIQHAIQEIEGFSGGANIPTIRKISDLMKADTKEIHQKMAASEDYLEFMRLSDELEKAIETGDDARVMAIVNAQDKVYTPEVAEIYQAARDIREVWDYQTMSAGAEYIDDILFYPHKADDPVWDVADADYDERRLERIAFAKYRRSMGEVEARNVQRRNKMEAEKRKTTPLEETEDVPRGFQRLMAHGEDAASLNVIGWHGTPHWFDRFLTAFIGTGEGQQAHGWGLYFGGDRKVAEGYRNGLSRAKVIDDLLDEYEPTFDTLADLDARFEEGAFPEQTTKLPKALRKDQWLGFDRADEAVQAAFHDVSNGKNTLDMSPETVEAVSGYGRLFEVDLPDVSVMLDEQKAFRDQPAIVQKVMGRLLGAKAESKEFETATRNMKDDGLRYGIAKNVYKFESAVKDVTKALDGMEFRKDRHDVSREYLAVTHEDFNRLAARIAGTINSVGLDEYASKLWANDPLGVPSFRNPFEARLRVAEKMVDSLIAKKNKDHRTSNLSGFDMYRALSKWVGGDREASLLLDRLGVKGITYDGKRDGRCYVVFNDKAVDIVEYYSVDSVSASVVGDAEWKADVDLIERAKANFGVTTDAREAFYVLPDGTMLDGSGRHWVLANTTIL